MYEILYICIGIKIISNLCWRFHFRLYLNNITILIKGTDKKKSTQNQNLIILRVYVLIKNSPRVYEEWRDLLKRGKLRVNRG